MKKLIFIILILNKLFAINDILKIQNLMGSDNYYKYNKLIDKIFPAEEYNITTIISELENNGLIPLFFNKARIVQTEFTFINSNPILSQNILNNSLRDLGYLYFYPLELSKENDKYSVLLEMKSEHFIDPKAFVKEISLRGCNILDISKNNDIFQYKIDCENGFIKEINEMSDKNQKFINPNGVYWFKSDKFSKMSIKTSKLDFWHPSVWFYDKDMNLINVYRKKIIQRKILLFIPQACKYIKITDMYDPENFKRGIIVKAQ
jgi:hypothetical protein